MPTAIIFPPNPEGLVFNMVAEAAQGIRQGLRLYTNGRQFALLPRPIPGWVLWSI